MFTILLALIVASLAISVISLIYTASVRSKLRILLMSIKARTLKSYIKSLEERKKVRRRYLVFEFISEESIERHEFEELVKRYFKELFGSVELTKAGISVVILDKKICKGIIKFNSIYRSKILTALALLQIRNGIIIHPLRTTGTLKKALRYAKLVKK